MDGLQVIGIFVVGFILFNVGWMGWRFWRDNF